MQNCLWSPQSAVAVTSFGVGQNKRMFKQVSLWYIKDFTYKVFFFLSPRQQGIKSQQKAKKTCLIEFSGCLHSRYRRLWGDINHRQTILLWGTEHTRERGCGQKAILSGRLREYEIWNRIFLFVNPAEASAPWPSQCAPLIIVPIFSKTYWNGSSCSICHFQSENSQLCCTGRHKWSSVWEEVLRKWAVEMLLYQVWTFVERGMSVRVFPLGNSSSHHVWDADTSCSFCHFPAATRVPWDSSARTLGWALWILQKHGGLLH